MNNDKTKEDIKTSYKAIAIKEISGPESKHYIDLIKGTSAAAQVLFERARQIEDKGYDPDHDRSHPKEALALAGAFYALPAEVREKIDPEQKIWPFEKGYFKPSPLDRKRELVKAAALIIAEIERTYPEETEQQGTLTSHIFEEVVDILTQKNNNPQPGNENKQRYKN